jgi:hypothetical protein
MALTERQRRAIVETIRAGLEQRAWFDVELERLRPTKRRAVKIAAARSR